MLGKIYFPRIIFPLTPVIAKLVDFSISLILLMAVMIYYNVMPSLMLLYLPLFLLMMVCIPTAIGLWLSSLAIRFRDVKFAMPFVMKMLIYSAPILYSADQVPEEFIFWYALNPLVGVIEGFRSSLLGNPLPWELVWPGICTLAVLLFSGALYFRRMERVVVDVI